MRWNNTTNHLLHSANTLDTKSVISVKATKKANAANVDRCQERVKTCSTLKNYIIAYPYNTNE